MHGQGQGQILKERSTKLGLMTAFACASASVLALLEIPAANTSTEGDSIVYLDYVDMSVTVATPESLVTPLLRYAEAMGFLDIEKGITELGKKVRSN